MVTQKDAIQFPLSRPVCFNLVYDVLNSVNALKIVSMSSTMYIYGLQWKTHQKKERWLFGSKTKEVTIHIDISLQELGKDNTEIILVAKSVHLLEAKLLNQVIQRLIVSIGKHTDHFMQNEKELNIDNELSKAQEREWMVTTINIQEQINQGKDRRLQYLQSQTTNATPHYIKSAINALKMGDKLKAYELVEMSGFELDNFSLSPDNKTKELTLLVLSEIFDKPETIARCLLAIINRLNPKNKIAIERLDLLNSFANTPQKRNEVKVLKEKIYQDLDNPRLHYELGVKYLSSTPYFMTIDQGDSIYWDGFEGEELIPEILDFEDELVTAGKEEVYLALILDKGNGNFRNRAVRLLADIKRLEGKNSFEALSQPRNVEYAKLVFEHRAKKILEQTNDIRKQIVADQTNSQLHFEIAQTLYKAIPIEVMNVDNKNLLIYDCFKKLVEESKEEYLIAIAIGLRSPLDAAKARLNLAILSYPDDISKTLSREAIQFAKKHLRRYPQEIEALEIIRDGYVILENDKEFEKAEFAIKQAERLIERGIISDKRSMNVEDENKSQKADGVILEEKVQKLLQALGLRASMTKASGDGGIDVIAFSEDPIFSGKYIVQCKDWTNPVGEPVVRDLFGVVVSEGANKGILITTGRFTDAAERFAEGKQLELIDGNELQKFIRQFDI